MRIGIDARVLQQPRRGQGQYVYYLVKGLLKQSRDNECVLFYNGLRRQPFVFGEGAQNLKQVWCRFPGTLLARSWSRAAFPPVEWFLGGTDVFHNTINFNFTHYTPIPTSGRMVATFHGMADPSSMWDVYDNKKIYRWFDIIAGSAHQIIATSNMARDILKQNMSVDAGRISVIYYGVDDIFRPIEDKAVVEKAVSKYGLSGKKYLLCVGTAEKNKNLMKLVEAFKIISQDKQYKDLLLVLAGETDQNYIKLQEEIGNIGMSGKVILTGNVGHEDLVYLYNGAAAFVLPSLLECFGIPAAEALACGIPAVISDNTGILEVARDAVTTFDPQDHEEMAERIKMVLADDALRASLKEKGFAAARRLTWDNVAKETLEVYRKAMAR